MVPHSTTSSAGVFHQKLREAAYRKTRLRISSDRSDVYLPLFQRTLIEQRSVSYTKK